MDVCGNVRVGGIEVYCDILHTVWDGRLAHTGTHSSSLECISSSYSPRNGLLSGGLWAVTAGKESKKIAYLLHLQMTLG